MACRDCKYLSVGLNRAGRRAVRKDYVYACIAPDPEPLSLPLSITQHGSFTWPPPRSFMTGADGEGCPAHAPIRNQHCGNSALKWGS